jgi:hypothetical protein
MSNLYGTKLIEVESSLTTPIDAESPEAVLLELWETCQKMRELISGRLPQALIGYLWAQVLTSLIGRHSPD